MSNLTYHDYDFDANIAAWSTTFKRSKKAPLEANRIWATLADATAYVNDYTNYAVAGLTMSVINDGDNNGLYLIQFKTINATTGEPVPSTDEDNNLELVKISGGITGDIYAEDVIINTIPGIVANNVQGAIAELSGKVVNSTSGISAVAVDSETVASSGVATIVTEGGDYNSTTNKLATVNTVNGMLGALAAYSITTTDINNWNNKSDFDGNYNSLSNKPDIVGISINAVNGVIGDIQVQSDWAETNNSVAGYIKNKPELSTVATSGNYNDLTNKPDIATISINAVNGVLGDVNISRFTNDAGYITLNQVPGQVQSDWTETNNSVAGYIKNKPTLATVATSGNYNDLTNKPTIPAAQVNADWNADSGVAEILNKPTIPNVYNSTISIYQGETLAGSFNLNQNENASITLTQGITSVEAEDVTLSPVPGIVANNVQGAILELSNKVVNGTSGISTVVVDTITVDSGGIATIYTDGNDYNPTTNKLATVNTVNGMLGAMAAYSITTTDINNWNNKSDFDGNYNDLTNKPDIPNIAINAVNGVLGEVNVSRFVNDANYITLNQVPGQVQSDWTETNNSVAGYIKNKPTLATVATSGSYNDLTNKPDIPTVNDATLTVKVNNTSVGTFTANASQNKSINVDVPTTSQIETISINAVNGVLGEVNVSRFVNDAGYISLNQVPGQVQSNWTETNNSVAGYIKNKPTLATVATSGSYNDLTNKPTIPAAQVNADWNADSGVAEILHKPKLATVATSGNYNDLDNRPTIPIVNDATLEIRVNNFSVGTFTANASKNSVIGIDIPTTNQIENISINAVNGVIGNIQVQSDWTETNNSVAGYIKHKPTLFSGNYNDLTNKPNTTAPIATLDALSGTVNLKTIINEVNGTVSTSGGITLAKVASTGNYNDLTNQPDIPNIAINAVNGAMGHLQVNADWNADSGVAEILNKPKLATVATSGSYNDLDNRPTIFSGNYNDLTNKPTTTATIATANSQTGIVTLASTINEVNGSISTSGGITLAKVAYTGKFGDIDDLPRGEATIATANSQTGVVTLKTTVNQTNGAISSNGARDVSLAKVASTGIGNDLVDYTEETWTFTMDNNQERTVTILIKNT